MSEEKVEFCTSCLSLAILDDGYEPYCNVCGGTDISSAGIEEWQGLYEKRFGESFLKSKKPKWEQEKRKNINKIWKSID